MKKILLSFASVMALGISFVWAADMMHEANLLDVTGGSEIRSVAFENTDISGYGMAYWDEETSAFHLGAHLDNLPTPNGDDFYEGWLVQQSPFKFISTWEVMKTEDGKMVNKFDSSIDYSTYDFYVLNLEPNDNDPAPADHILEGTITVSMWVHAMKSEGEMMKHDGMMMKDWDAMMEKEDAMMKDSMMDKPDMMKSEMMDDTMMDSSMKEMAMKSTYYTKIKTVLATIDSSKLAQLAAKIPAVKASYMNNDSISETQKEKVAEILNVILVVIEEMTMTQK